MLTRGVSKWLRQAHVSLQAFATLDIPRILGMSFVDSAPVSLHICVFSTQIGH
jgi:hypothetical protein